MGVDQFSQTGTQVFAVNVNGPALTMTQSGDPDIVFTATSADLDTSALNLNYGGYFANPGAGNNDIIRFGSYNSSATASTISLNNLDVGSTYRVQVLVADGRGAQTGRTISFDAIDQGRYANGVGGTTWGDSLLVTGTFVADTESQSFTMQGFNANSTTAGSQVNAVLLHRTAVPEPSGVVLFGLAGLTMFLRRRR